MVYVRNASMNLKSPPPKCETLGTAPISESAFQIEQNEHGFYRFSKVTDSIRQFAEKMGRNRLHYVRQVEKDERDMEISQATKERVKVLDRIMRGQSPPDSFLTSDRHAWRQCVADFDVKNPRVCAVPSCSAVPLDGSRFCFHHILRDERQSLFVACPECGRPKPRAGTCLACGNLHL